MSATSNRPPAYRRQRENGRSDRAYVRINGQKIKLGIYGSDESRAKYAELICSLGDDVPPAPLEPSDNPTVAEVILAYLAHAERYYRQPDGSGGREYELTADVCKYVR